MPNWRKRNTTRARQLRRASTPAERAIWVHRKNRQLDGFRFNRQVQIGLFYCDLLCRQERLAIQLDGFSHDIQPGRDRWRDRILAEYGVRVLHFTNQDVFQHMEGVLHIIRAALSSGPPPAPPASGRGEE